MPLHVEQLEGSPAINLGWRFANRRYAVYAAFGPGHHLSDKYDFSARHTALYSTKSAAGEFFFPVAARR